LGLPRTVGAEGRPRRARPTTIRQDIADGVTYALRTPEIRAVLGVLFVISFCVFNFSIWVPLPSVSTAFFVRGAGGLAALALIMGARRRLDHFAAPANQTPRSGKGRR
jgi:hypothetical protein